jgi:hypothetical protein
MNVASRWDNRQRAFVGSLVTAAFVWTLVLAVSPQLHERIHPDSNRVNHTCAITLVASGSCNHSPAPLLISAPAPTIESSQPLELNSVWIQSIFLRAHLFAHAPPALI